MAHTVGFYGETNSWKTAQLREVAIWLYEKYLLPVRYFAMDISGMEVLKDVVDAGIVQPLILMNNMSPISLLRAISKGCWLPWVERTTPQGKIWTLSFPGETITINGVQYYNDPRSPLMLEGWSVFSNAVMMDMLGKRRRVAQDVVAPFFEVSYNPNQAEESVSAPAMAHYGTVQNFMLSIISEVSRLPTDFVFWTAHEAKGKDEFTGSVLLGPRLIGKAGTAPALPLFHDYFHCEIVQPSLVGMNFGLPGAGAPAAGGAAPAAPIDASHPLAAMMGGAGAAAGAQPIATSQPIAQFTQASASALTAGPLERRAYFERHACAEIFGQSWPASLRLAASEMNMQTGRMIPGGNYSRVKEVWPDGYIPLSKGQGIVDYLRLRETLIKQSTNQLTAWKERLHAARASTGLVAQVQAPPIQIQAPAPVAAAPVSPAAPFIFNIPTVKL